MFSFAKLISFFSDNESGSKKTARKPRYTFYHTLTIKRLIVACQSESKAVSLINELTNQLPCYSNYSYNVNAGLVIEVEDSHITSLDPIAYHIKLPNLTWNCQLALAECQVKLLNELYQMQLKMDEEHLLALSADFIDMESCLVSPYAIKDLISDCKSNKDANPIINRLLEEVPRGVNYTCNYNHIAGCFQATKQHNNFYMSQYPISIHINIKHLSEHCFLSLDKEQARLYFVLGKLKQYMKDNADRKPTVSVSQMSR